MKVPSFMKPASTHTRLCITFVTRPSTTWPGLTSSSGVPEGWSQPVVGRATAASNSFLSESFLSGSCFSLSSLRGRTFSRFASSSSAKMATSFFMMPISQPVGLRMLDELQLSRNFRTARCWTARGCSLRNLRPSTLTPPSPSGTPRSCWAIPASSPTVFATSSAWRRASFPSSHSRCLALTAASRLPAEESPCAAPSASGSSPASLAHVESGIARTLALSAAQTRCRSMSSPQGLRETGWRGGRAMWSMTTPCSGR
mmetsp:Transcript_39254/g.110951  ORF Transcript_39254/g.110951 Transcript_39254/m.110951 type:complete len:257 (+) Transcript_39254:805-1575(+)